MLEGPEQYHHPEHKNVTMIECSETGEPSQTFGVRDEDGLVGGSEDESLFGGDDANQQENKLVLAKRETKVVRWLRVALILVLLGAAAAVSAGIFVYTDRNETEEFSNTFESYSLQILTTLQTYARNKLEAMGALALDVQIYAVTNNLTWPNVTVPYFEDRVMATKSLTDAHAVLLFPVVTSSTRAGWEEYSVEHRGWIWDSYSAQRHVYGRDESQINPPELIAFPDSIDWWDHLWGPEYTNPNNTDFSSGISSQIMTTEHEDPDDYDPVYENGAGPYFPQWQAAPMSWYYQTTVNSNYGRFADFFQQTKVVNETGHVVFGEAWSDDNAPGLISTMLYPIFERFYSNEAKVVAFLAIDLFWQSFLEGILPPNSRGIDVVIENTCDQVFTFKILGEEAVWLGEGDLHDADFDFMERSALFGQYVMEPITDPTYYAGPPLDGLVCSYTFHVYATKHMQDYYLTNKPAIYSAIACLIILLTSLIFVSYDCIVERRQRILAASAQRSDAIVSSLFPAQVKEQLYEHQERSKNGHATSTHRWSKPSMKHPLSFAADDGFEDETEQIASLYPETTILFADIAGFTRWSDGREPHDVFLLLETIYFMFDKIAKRRGVFKFSTIGDCYLAATGIPTPQKDHALRMVKFAHDCQQCLPNLLLNLSDRLGEGTRDLAIRVGCHSGPVTAGVLRGDKIRFELFGDTVNTASRMESNGVCNRIHVSQATADLLIKANKGHWLTPREEKIFAKGKGYMQTYYVTVKGSGSSASSDYRKSGIFDEAHASALLEETIDVFDKISRRHRSTRNMRYDYMEQSDPSDLDGADESPSTTEDRDLQLFQKEEYLQSRFAPSSCSGEEVDNQSENSLTVSEAVRSDREE